MRPILSSSNVIARLLSGRNRSLDLNARLGFVRRYPDTRRRWERFAQSRCLASFARCGNPCAGQLFRSAKDLAPSIGSLHRYDQGRWFLGCGDGEEGSLLSKIYEERRVMGYVSCVCLLKQLAFFPPSFLYSPEQLFSVVEAVDLYEEFVPWCQRSTIIKRNSDGSFDAELEIGFKFLVESYVSHVEMEKPKYIKV
ncbi:hypothetical protein BHE74_00045560 [Ensete ventricosum]|nr:hypothetical protein BHE74_00045560 [Ensete ventricosum]